MPLTCCIICGVSLETVDEKGIFSLDFTGLWNKLKIHSS